MTTNALPARQRRRRGTGSQRESRPGVWEVRIPTGPDPVTGRTRHRSLTFHGTEAQASATRLRLAATINAPGTLPTGPLLTLGELLPAWLAADHPWKPSTLVGYRSTVRPLLADPVATTRVQALTPRLVRDHAARWRRAGTTDAVLAARIRVLRAAVGWAWQERLVEVHPIRGMRGPSRVPPRQPLAEEEERTLILTAELRLLEAQANHHPHAGGPGGPSTTRLHRAEQDLLLVRLAADTGARRGELAALQIGALDDRVLQIARAVSAGVPTTPKPGRGRVLTLGATTAELWHNLAAGWDARTEGKAGAWLFSADARHRHRLGAESLGHRFQDIRDAAGMTDATLHRLRHSVATFLVSRGQVLQAQARLGHADAATTLRECAYALPCTDGDVADALDTHLNTPPAPGSRLPALRLPASRPPDRAARRAARGAVTARSAGSAAADARLCQKTSVCVVDSVTAVQAGCTRQRRRRLRTRLRADQAGSAVRGQPASNHRDQDPAVTTDGASASAVVDALKAQQWSQADDREALSQLSSRSTSRARPTFGKTRPVHRLGSSRPGLCAGLPPGR